MELSRFLKQQNDNDFIAQEYLHMFTEISHRTANDDDEDGEEW